MRFLDRLDEVADGKTHVQLGCKFGSVSCVIMPFITCDDNIEIVCVTQLRSGVPMATKMVVRTDEVVSIMACTEETIDREVATIIDTFLAAGSNAKGALTEKEIEELGIK